MRIIFGDTANMHVVKKALDNFSTLNFKFKNIFPV